MFNSYADHVDDEKLDEHLERAISSMTEVPLSEFKSKTETAGFHYGPYYSLIRRTWRRGNEAICMLELDDNFTEELLNQYIVHPTITDACLQVSDILDF